MMIKNPQTKGYLLAILAAFTATNTYFTSKYILSTNTVFQFGILWYGFGLIYNGGFLAITGQLKQIFTLSRKSYMVLLLFGIAELVSTTSFFTAIKLMDNPAIVSFLANLVPPLVTVFGILLLKERFNRIELIGVLIAIAGAFMVCFHWEIGLKSLFISGSEYVFVSVLFVSLNTILTKKFVASIDPSIFSITRVIVLLIFSLIALFTYSQPFYFSADSIYFALYGAFVGPFLGAYAIYYSLKYIPATKSVIIQSTKSFIILLFAYFLLGLWPLWIQILGGLFSVTGVILITAFKNNKPN